MIDEDTDVALYHLAREEHTSKAALIRRFVKERLGAASYPGDPLFSMIGTDDYRSDGVDDVVYR